MPYLKAFIWDFFGKVATHGMGFIVYIFLARLLEPSDLGLIAMVILLIGITSVFRGVDSCAPFLECHKVDTSHYTSIF